MPSEPTHIQSTLTDLRAWRDQIDAAIQLLEHFDARGLSVPLSAPPSVARGNGDIPGDAFFQMTVPDAAAKYLGLVKTTKEISEIADALLKGGLKSASTNFPSMVRTVMSRDSRFVKVPDGGWGLSAWYSGMRKDKRSRGPVKKHSEDNNKSQAAQPGTASLGGSDTTAADKILAAMKSDQNSEWTIGSLTQHTGLKPKTVQGTIFRLRHDGKIGKRIDGKGYVLTKVQPS